MIDCPTKLPRGRSSERGVTLAFLAVFIPVLLLLLAFVLETSQLFYTASRLQLVANNASLAALEQYFSADCSGDGSSEENCRLQAAAQRAQEIAGRHILYGDDISFELLEAPENISGAVLLEFGRFISCVSNELPSHEQEFCNRYNDATGIFIPLEQYRESESGAIPTAARIRGNLFPYQGFLLRMLHRAGVLTPYSDAVATTLPRVIQVLIDVSATKVYDTHRLILAEDPNDFVPACGLGFRLAYPVNRDISAEQLESFQGNQWPTPDQVATELEPLWQYTLARGLRRDPEPDLHCTERPQDYLHFYDDYRSVTLLGDDHFDNFVVWYGRTYGPGAVPHPLPNERIGSPTSELTHMSDFEEGDFYFVDAYRPGTLRPEPLGTIFDGVLGLVDTFEARRVAGDMIGITALRGNHDRLPWSSTIRPTNNFDYLRDILSDEPRSGRPNNSNYLFEGEPFLESLGDADFNNVPLSVRLGFFPGRFPHTNGYLPLLDTINTFADMQAGGLQAAYSVVILTDGLFNCAYCNSETSPGWLGSGDTVACLNRCTNEYSAWAHATTEALELAWDSFAPGGVSINIISMTEDVAPHTMALLDGQGQCYSDSRFRQEFESAILAGEWNFTGRDEDPLEAFIDMAYNDSGAFASSNVPMWALTAITGGIFQPLREVTQPCTPSSLCNRAQSPLQIFPPGDSRYRPMNEFDYAELQEAMVSVEPSCRTPVQQINDVMRRLLEKNPYVNVLVDN